MKPGRFRDILFHEPTPRLLVPGPGCISSAGRYYIQFLGFVWKIDERLPCSDTSIGAIKQQTRVRLLCPL